MGLGSSHAPPSRDDPAPYPEPGCRVLVQPQRRAGVSLQGRDDRGGVNQGKAETEVPQDSGKHSQIEPLVVEAPEGGMERE